MVVQELNTVPFLRGSKCILAKIDFVYIISITGQIIQLLILFVFKMAKLRVVKICPEVIVENHSYHCVPFKPQVSNKRRSQISPRCSRKCGNLYSFRPEITLL